MNSRRNTAASERDSKRKTEELTGVFYSVRWQNNEGTFFIGSLKSGESIKGNAKPGSFIPGCEYVFAGRWETHPQYGQSFNFSSFRAKAPVTAEAVRSYLDRHIKGIGCGIGPAGITKLIASFGPEKVLHVLKYEPKNVQSLLGLSAQDAKLAADTLLNIERYETTRLELNQIFEGRGFQQGTIEACIDTFGVHAADAIKRDPFTMLVRGFPGCGFARVNALYESLNLPKNRLKRQVICLWHLLTEGNGSVWYDADWSSQELTRLVTATVNFRKALTLGIRAKWLSTYRDGSGKLWIAAAEHAVVEEQLSGLLAKFVLPYVPPPPKPPCPFDLDGEEEDEDVWAGMEGVI